MAVQSTTILDPLFRQYDDKKLKPLFARSDGFLKEIKKFASVVNVNQKGKVDTNHIRTHAGTSFSGPAPDYPVGASFVFDQYHKYAVNQTRTLQIDDMTFDDLQRGGENSLWSVGQMIQELVASLGEDRSQHFAQGNGTGAKATLTGSSTTTLLYGYTAPGGAAHKSHGTQQLYPDVVYDILTSAGALAHASHEDVTFSTVDYVNNTATPSSALGAAPANNSIVVTANSYNYGVRGLPYLISGTKTGMWQGVSVTNKPEHQSVHIDAGGAAISVALHQKLASKMKIRNRGKATYKIIGPPNQNDSYRAIGWNFRRFTSADKAMDLEFDESRYSGNPFMDFFEIDTDRQYVCDMADFEIVQQKEFGIISRNGQVWKEQVGANSTGKGSYYMNYGGADNLYIKTPKAHGVLLNLEVPSDSATVANVFATS